MQKRQFWPSILGYGAFLPAEQIDWAHRGSREGLVSPAGWRSAAAWLELPFPDKPATGLAPEAREA
jgi:hypothetical protein